MHKSPSRPSIIAKCRAAKSDFDAVTYRRRFLVSHRKGQKVGEVKLREKRCKQSDQLSRGSAQLIQYAALRCIPLDSSERGMAISPTFVSCALPVCYAYEHGVALAHAVTFLGGKENPVIDNLTYRAGLKSGP